MKRTFATFAPMAMLFVSAGCADSTDGADGSAAPDAGAPETVSDAVDRIEGAEERFAVDLCGCDAFVARVEEQFGVSLEGRCNDEFSTSGADWDCLRENFGAEDPESVPGLSCHLGVIESAASCIGELNCGEGRAEMALACVEQRESGIDECDLGSLSSDDPPALAECL